MAKRFMAFLAGGLLAAAAHAGYDEGIKAFEAKDYATALTEMRKGAQAKDPRAYLLLGVMSRDGLGMAADPQQSFVWFIEATRSHVTAAYPRVAWALIQGSGIPRNPQHALEFARFAARQGDAESLFLVYFILNDNELAWRDEKGVADMAKYNRLAARPLQERKLDMEAYDSLYLAAEMKQPMAVKMLASSLGGVLGDGNRARMSRLIKAIPAPLNPGIAVFDQVSHAMDKTGRSYASPQLFADTLNSTTATASARLCAGARLVSMDILETPHDAVYLPSSLPGYEHAYLMSGHWREKWIFNGCGKTLALEVNFNADGLGGATFSAGEIAGG